MKNPLIFSQRSCVRKILLVQMAAMLWAAVPGEAKLASDRWSRVSEEERHQLTRAESYFEQNNFKNALSEYELFLQLYTKSEVGSYVQLMLAECTLRLGKVNAAFNEFRNVIDYFPDTLDAGVALYSIGICQMKSGDAEAAVKTFEKVIEIWPKEDFGALARNEACTIYFRNNKTDKWTAHMDYLANGEYKDTQNLRKTAIRRLVMARLMEKKTADAYALIEPTKGKEPLVVFAEWVGEALRPNEIPRIYGDAGKKAVGPIATESVALLEKNSVSLTDPAKKLSIEQWQARILASAGVTEKATERYAALSKKYPENDGIRMEYANHLRSSGKKGEARLLYHELKDQYAGDREIAESYGEENNWNSCIETYQAMLGKYPEKVGQIQWRLGEVLQRSGKYPEAIAAFQLAQMEPQALFRIAECQGAMKQNDAAIQTLVGISNFFKPSAAEAQYRMAGYQAAKGEKDSAIRTLKGVCKAFLNTPWAGRAHEELSLKYGVDVTLGGASKKDDQ